MAIRILSAILEVRLHPERMNVDRPVMKVAVMTVRQSMDDVLLMIVVLYLVLRSLMHPQDRVQVANPILVLLHQTKTTDLENP